MGVQMKRFLLTLALSPVVIPVEGFITGSSFRGLCNIIFTLQWVLRSRQDELFNRLCEGRRLLADLSIPELPFFRYALLQT